MCLLLSPRETGALAEAARTAGVDIAALHKTGRLRVLRIPSAPDLAAKGNAGLDAAYRDLAALAARANAHRVVIEDFTPLVQYTTFAAFDTAFESLRTTLAKTGAAFLLGLGEPANEPSKRLLDIVAARVDATVRVASGENGREVTVEEAPEPAAQRPADASPRPADPEPQAPVPQAATPAPTPAPEAADPAPVARPDATPEATPEDPFAHTADPTPTPAAASDFFSAEPTQPFAAQPVSPASSDGASFPIDEPLAPAAPEPPLGMEIPAPPFGIGNASLSHAVSETFEPSTPSTPRASRGMVTAGIEIAPPPDPDLLAPTADPFGRDPGTAFFDNGYLVDSKGAPTIPVTTVHQEAYPEVFTLPAPAPEAAPRTPAAMPSFGAIPTAPPADDDGAGATRRALDEAFSAREVGTPFLVVAARMEPAQPESISFETVIDGLRKALPSHGTLYADSARLRSLLVLPGADAAGAQKIFATLQQHLQQHLGLQAAATLQAVAAITVPDGQPFGSSEELWAYAVES